MELDALHIPTGARIRQQRGILLTQGLPIQTVHFRIVKEIAIAAPGVIINLLPLFSWHQLHDETVCGDRLFKTLFRLSTDYTETIIALHQQAGMVRCGDHSIHICKNRLLFLILDIIKNQLGIFFGRARVGPSDVSDLAIKWHQGTDVASRWWQ